MNDNAIEDTGQDSQANLPVAAVLDRILTVVSGSPAARPRMPVAELPDVIDIALTALSRQMLLSVPGLLRMLPGPLSTAELDRLRELIPASSVRDAVRENVFMLIQDRRDQLASAIAAGEPPSGLAGALHEWPSLEAIPAQVIAEVCAQLSQFVGMRIVRVHGYGVTHLYFEDPTKVRFYSVEGDLTRWLRGHSSTPGLPADWIGEPVYDLPADELVETSPHDLVLPDPAP
ncbi:hypothetical protein [Nocardia sp. NPDC050710]|uniref:hypothetical protein n=1 Tax=Nocardia sp. NPDC050710 TaxID=3157220 RepID=UPI0033FDF447